MGWRLDDPAVRHDGELVAHMIGHGKVMTDQQATLASGCSIPVEISGG